MLQDPYIRLLSTYSFDLEMLRTSTFLLRFTHLSRHKSEPFSSQKLGSDFCSS